MKKTYGVPGSRLAFFAFLLLMVAGCNGGGIGGDDPVAPPMAMSLPSSDTFGSLAVLGDSDSSGDDGSSDDGSVDAGITVATVHNPEPGSMVLLGIGLAGLARLRRRK